MDESSPLRFTYDMNCVEGERSDTVTLKDISAAQNPDDLCHYIVTVDSPEACAIASVNIYVRFLNVWGWTHAFFLILGGVFVGFFGHSRFRSALVVTMASVSFFVIIVVVCECGWFDFWYSRQVIPVTWFQYLITIFIVAASLLIGAFCGHKVSERVGIVFMCLLGGLMASSAVYIVYLSFAANIYALIVLTSILMIICSILPFKCQQTMSIESTSFVGSYAIMRGVALLVGGFPSEVQLFTWLFKGVHLQQGYNFTFYIVFLCVLFLIA